MNIEVLFTKATDWHKIGGYLIMAADRVPFSHVSIKLGSQVYEAVIPKSRKISFPDWYEGKEIVASFSLHCDKPTEEIIQIFENLVGRDYSVPQLVWIFCKKYIRPLAKIVGHSASNGAKNLICTELAGRGLEQSFEIKIDGDPDNWSLITIYRLCKKLEGL